MEWRQVIKTKLVKIAGKLIANLNNVLKSGYFDSAALDKAVKEMKEFRDDIKIACK